MSSPFNGECPSPFLDETLFSKTGGFLKGRSCAPNPLQGENATTNCCIPCPVYDYLYPDDFKQMTDGAAWVHVAGFILCGFLLISMAILPVRATRRSYLNVLLLVGIMLMELGFIIPLARQPEQCYNEITPNDMYSSTTCAFSGAFAAFGGMTLVTWILVRALFMHLQICWDIAPTKHHYIAATIAASTVTIGLVSAVLAHAGVSFRFGGYCHVNHTGSIATYWAWLLAFSGLALLLQLATFAYCIKVYLQAALLRSDVSAMSTTRSGQSGGRKGSAAPSALSSRSRSARAAARRLRMVLLLQWRSLAIVALAIFTTAFVCVVFIVLDNRQERLAFADTEALVPWIVCMILTRDNEQCLDKTGPIIIPERITVATLFILAFVGVEAFVLLCRTNVFRAWWELVRKPFGKKKGALVAQPEVEAIGRGQRFGSAVSAEMAERIGSAPNEAERADSTAERGEVVRATSTERVERTSSATAAPHAL